MRSVLVILAFALASFLAVSIALQHGMPMNPDGWAYWEGSVSILDSGGTSLEGVPLSIWPAGYFIYLSACQALFGVSGRALVLATALAAALTTAAWGWFLADHIRQRGQGESKAALACALTYCTFAVVTHSMSLRAESILHALVPLALLVARRIGHSLARGVPFGRYLLLTLLLSASVLVKNAAMALVLAMGWLIAAPITAWRPRADWVRRVGPALLVLALVGLLWTVTTGRLTSRGWVTFPFGFGLGRFGPLEYALQLATSLGKKEMGDGLGQTVVALCCLALWRADREIGERQGRRLLAFAGLALLALYGIFNLTFVYDPLTARFTAFASLLVVSVGLVDSRRAFARGLALGLIGVACTSAAVRAGRHMLAPRFEAPPHFTTSPEENFVPNDVTIPHRGFDPAHSQLRLVQPPVFPWQKPAAGRRSDRASPDDSYRETFDD